MKRKPKKIDAGRPRQLTNQQAWYYLPFDNEQYISICKQVGSVDASVVMVKISARKLLRELLAIGLKP